MSETRLEPPPHIRPVGPVDVLVVGFPDAQLQWQHIAEALAELVANGTIRLLDMLIVYVDASGETTVAEITDIDGDGVPDLIAMQFDTPGLLTDADAAAAVEGLPPASAILLIAWENPGLIRASMALRGRAAFCSDSIASPSPRLTTPPCWTTRSRNSRRSRRLRREHARNDEATSPTQGNRRYGGRGRWCRTPHGQQELPGAGRRGTAGAGRPSSPTAGRASRSSRSHRSSQIDEATQLAGLRDQGVLTDAEFDAQKARILGG